jgi:hypothetical protein
LLRDAEHVGDAVNPAKKTVFVHGDHARQDGMLSSD